MQRVVLVTGHVFHSRRRAGFHFLAEALHRSGWEVTFFTAPISRLSWLRGDYRIALLDGHRVNRLTPVADRLQAFVWHTLWHPANLRSRILNGLARPLYARYGELPLGEAEGALRAADCILFESTPALLLFDRLKHLNASARFVYRVSDDIRFLGHHPLVIETEERVAPQFDLISSPCEALHRRFAHLPNARRQYHGIDKVAFDVACENPYPSGAAFNAVFVGNAHLDADFIHRAGRLFPGGSFHVIGPFAGTEQVSTVNYHGEVPFRNTIPWIRHADLGLMNLTERPGAEVFTDSLKVIQYTYCRLPIVAPEFLRCDRPNFVYYRPGDDASIRSAIEQARSMERAVIPTADIQSWDDVVRLLVD